MREGPGARRPLRVGVLGCGYIADIHLRSLQRGGPVEVIAADAAPDAAAHFVAAHGGRAVRPDELASADLDVAYLCTPHHVRSGPLEELAAALPLVVCEKPLALSAEEAGSLAERLGEDGKKVVIAFNQRFMPGVRALASWLAERRGDIRRIRLDLTSPPFLHTWAGTAEHGGGVLVSLGSHALDLWGHLTGGVAADVSVVASRVVMPPSREPDTAAVVLRDSDGLLSTVTMQDAGSTWWSMEAGRMLDIDVRTGAAAARAGAVSFESWEDETREIATQDLRSGDFLDEWGYAAMAGAVRRRLRGVRDGDTALLASLEDGLATARLVERARRAAAEP